MYPLETSHSLKIRKEDQKIKLKQIKLIKIYKYLKWIFLCLPSSMQPILLLIGKV